MKKTLYLLTAVAGLFILLTSELDYASGSPGGKSGSPGDGGNTCTQCHGGSATMQEGWITSTIPAEGYVPGDNYTITATGTHVGVVKFGFEVTSEDMNDAKKGTLIVTNSTETKLANGNASITHKNTGTTPSGNSKSWSFDWTAPEQGTGPISFYGAFNAANGNGNTSGDVIYTSILSVDEYVAPEEGITLNLTGMTPHVGEFFEARLIDKYTQLEVERLSVEEIMTADFEISFTNTEDGKSYWIDFYADHNDNGYYDGIPTDHAWRLSANDVMGATSMVFVHNTDFNEINFKHMYKIEFSGMTPHIDKKLEIRLINQDSMEEVGRKVIEAIPGDEFDVMLPYTRSGESYYVDFYADHNANGVYDAPPADHAWRIELTEVEGDEDDSFVHNTNFTDIGWAYQLTLHAMEMAPHLGEMFELRLVNQSTMEEAGRVDLDSIALVDFSVRAIGLELDEDYYVDFYADHNANGNYDAPPTDHAWRLELNDVVGDSELDFTHNTNFTDIEWPTVGIRENEFAKMVHVYPNPVTDQFTIGFLDSELLSIETSIYNAMGKRVWQSATVSSGQEVKINISSLNKGLYYLILKLNNGEIVTKSIIKN